MAEIIIFLYGITLGSFYNVVGLRIPVNQSIVKPRSHCPNCNHTLSAIELIPVLSYVLLRGKCRRCKAPISPFYPIVELLTGLLFAAAPLIIGWSYELIIAWTLISLMVIVFVSDVHYMIIPDKVLIVFTLLLVAERFFLPLTPWWDSLAGAAAGFILLLVIAIISRGGMGGGDIKLFAVIGLAVGTKLLLIAFFLSTLFGAVFGLAGMAIGKIKTGKPMAFGPYIGLGTITAYFFGERILQWYIDFF